MKRYNWIDVLDAAMNLDLKMDVKATEITHAAIEEAISTGSLQDARVIEADREKGKLLQRHDAQAAAWLALAIEADEDNITTPITLYVGHKALTVEDGRLRLRAYQFLAQEDALARGIMSTYATMRDLPLAFVGPRAEELEARLREALA